MPLKKSTKASSGRRCGSHNVDLSFNPPFSLESIWRAEIKLITWSYKTMKAKGPDTISGPPRSIGKPEGDDQ